LGTTKIESSNQEQQLRTRKCELAEFGCWQKATRMTGGLEQPCLVEAYNACLLDQ